MTVVATTTRPAPPVRLGRLAAQPWALSALLLVAAVGLRLWTPSDEAASSVCLFRRCTGVSCPGCGMTRGLAYLVRGDLASSWRYHPLALLFALEAIVAVSLAWLVRRGRTGFSWHKHGAWWLAAHIPLLLGVWLFRAFGGSLPI